MTRMLTPDDVANRLGTTTRTLAEWRKKGIGPRFKQAAPGHSVFYPENWLEEWEGGRSDQNDRPQQ